MSCFIFRPGETAQSHWYLCWPLTATAIGSLGDSWHHMFMFFLPLSDVLSICFRCSQTCSSQWVAGVGKHHKGAQLQQHVRRHPELVTSFHESGTAKCSLYPGEKDEHDPFGTTVNSECNHMSLFAWSENSADFTNAPLQTLGHCWWKTTPGAAVWWELQPCPFCPWKFGKSNSPEPSVLLIWNQ